MTTRIDINADMGESYGRWTLGNDAALMPFLTSANIACGFHGSDPAVMRATVRLAKQHGVGIGAHVGLPDLIGFGRRRIEISPQELKDYVVYQTGALRGFAAAEGANVEHVKPHGALYVMCTQEDQYAQAVVEAIQELGGDLILLLSSERVAAAAKRAGVPFVTEAYIDLDYNPDGTIILERAKQPRAPEQVAARAVTVANKHKVPIREGGWFPLAANSVCVHGDGANAPDIARVVRQRLQEAGVDVAPLRKLL
jgi:UPF0271 protein